MSLYVADKGSSGRKTQALVELMRDALLHIPASSVNVEKLHANTQELSAAHKSGRAEKSLQLHTYIMSSRLEHARMKKHVHDDSLGPSKKRAGQLLANRVVSRTTPGRTMCRVRRSLTVLPHKLSVKFLGYILSAV